MGSNPPAVSTTNSRALRLFLVDKYAIMLIIETVVQLVEHANMLLFRQ